MGFLIGEEKGGKRAEFSAQCSGTAQGSNSEQPLCTRTPAAILDCSALSRLCTWAPAATLDCRAVSRLCTRPFPGHNKTRAAAFAMPGCEAFVSKGQTSCIAWQLRMSLAIESKPGFRQYVELATHGVRLLLPHWCRESIAGAGKVSQC